ncbi:MAG: hypothetical protein A2096_03625 [Spirochaetes bacterium GWF1_41_5]|nr:MAG: hypothetical protein A2096_03625 [Spirochaetes bacterium GWF1_41_5]HBE02946.1 hypothetical protein [Spirochaetia bacterium]
MLKILLQLLLNCTSFVNYDTNTVYGMNFDFFNTDTYLTILQTNQVTVYKLQFKWNGEYIPTVLYNSYGLFLSYQYVIPVNRYQRHLEGNEKYITDVHSFIYNSDNISGILEFTQKYKLADWIFSIHLHAADKNNFAIIETGKSQNHITTSTNYFSIMANFNNYRYKDCSVDSIHGAGSDRYKYIYRQLSKDRNLSINKAFFLLQNTAMRRGIIKTIFSVVIDPHNNEMFLTRYADYKNILKIFMIDKKAVKYSENGNEQVFFIENDIEIDDLFRKFQ